MELAAGPDGLSVDLSYVHEEETPVVWHHRRLDGVLEVGDPIRLHEQYHVLGGPKGWFSVVITDGLGGIAEPDDKTGWAVTGGVVDLRTGVALATDHHKDGPSQVD